MKSALFGLALWAGFAVVSAGAASRAQIEADWLRQEQAQAAAVTTARCSAAHNS